MAVIVVAEADQRPVGLHGASVIPARRHRREGLLEVRRDAALAQIVAAETDQRPVDLHDRSVPAARRHRRHGGAQVPQDAALP